MVSGYGVVRDPPACHVLKVFHQHEDTDTGSVIFCGMRQSGFEPGFCFPSHRCIPGKGLGSPQPGDALDTQLPSACFLLPHQPQLVFPRAGGFTVVHPGSGAPSVFAKMSKSSLAGGACPGASEAARCGSPLPASAGLSGAGLVRGEGFAWKILPAAEVASCFIDVRRAQAAFFSFIPAFGISLLGGISGVWVPVTGWTIRKICN